MELHSIYLDFGVCIGVVDSCNGSNLSDLLMSMSLSSQYSDELNIDFVADSFPFALDFIPSDLISNGGVNDRLLSLHCSMAAVNYIYDTNKFRRNEQSQCKSEKKNSNCTFT